MSILNKFKSIEINFLDMLSEEDVNFLNELQKDYDDIYDKLIDVINKLKYFEELKKYPESNLYDSICYNIRTDKIVLDSIPFLNNSFNDKIIHYFEITYSINLEHLKYTKNTSDEHLKRDKLHYKELVERVFTLGMNGKSFENVRIEQLKKDLENLVLYKTVSVKKNKLIINDFMYFIKPSYSWETDYYTSSYNKLKTLALALNEFCGCPIDLIYKSKLDHYKTEFEEIGSVTEVNYDIINSYKLFKNGKIEINFTNHDSAVNFAKEWLNRNV